MARVSTTLERIENIQKEQNKIVNEKERQKQLEKEYKKDLQEITKDIIENEFDSFISYKETYNNLFLNEQEYLGKIEEELLNIKVETSYEYWDEKTSHWKINKIQEEKYAEVYNFHDIEEEYFKLLKQIYNKYNNKTKISKELMLESLESNMRDFFKERDYDYAYSFIIDEDIRKSLIDAIAEDTEQYNFLDINYVKTLNKVAKDFKYKQVKRPKKNGNFISNHPIMACGFGIINGICKGLKK